MKIASIDGIIKLSAPNASKQANDKNSPSNELVWSFSLSHCSRKITTNIAVITKSSPSSFIVISEPKIPPIVAPETQYI